MKACRMKIPFLQYDLGEVSYIRTKYDITCPFLSVCSVTMAGIRTINEAIWVWAKAI